MTGKARKIDWMIVIPMLFWISCIAISSAKVAQSSGGVHIIDYIDCFNSNTFSTYISLVICMAYQFFSADKGRQEERSGLSRKWIAGTIISTVVYGIVAVINTCLYGLPTTIVMAFASITYVWLFFKYMRTDNR